MVGNYCMVPGCSARTRKIFMKKHFHRVPKDLELTKKWLRAINDPKYGEDTPMEAVKNRMVCSLHFKPEDLEPNPLGYKKHVLRKSAIPSIFTISGDQEQPGGPEPEEHVVNGHPTPECPNPIAAIPTTVQRKNKTVQWKKNGGGRKALTKRTRRPKPTKDTASQNPAGDAASTAKSGRKRRRVQRSRPPTTKRPSIVVKNEEETSPVTVTAENTQREIQAEPSPAQSGPRQWHIHGSYTPPAPTETRLDPELGEALATLKKTLAGQKQEMLNLKKELEAKNSQIQLLGKELNRYTTNALTPECLNNSHVPPLVGYFHYCTGFTYDQFNSLCESFKVPNDPFTPQRYIPLSYKTPDIEIQRLPLRSQFLLTLMKLRQHFDDRDLAFRFQIGVQSVSNLINSWVDYMYDRLGQLSVWPHRHLISQHMSLKFKEEFPNTFAILDCTELKTEKPGCLLLQSQTSKTSNTLRSLVACDPRGAVVYVSALYAGSISDKEIFDQCNNIELLQGCIQRGYLKVGDGLMTDQGFLIEQQDLRRLGLRFNVLPFARSDRQMPPKMPDADVEMSKKIAKHRAHVERAVAKIKKFKIVSGRISMSQLYNINQIWYVVSMLSNFQPDIKDQ